MYVKCGICVVLISLLYTECAGIQCWTCDNEPSIFHCVFRGEIKTCLPNQLSCETKVRRCGEKLAVTKRCKQTQACVSNARIQVTPNFFNGVTECNTDQENSICTCCCKGSRCNLNSNSCSGMGFACPVRQPIENVETTCSKGNEAGSVCRFTCPQPDYFIHPPTSQEIRCLKYGQWEPATPCCARSCPPFLFNDVLFMRQARNPQAWEEFQRRVVSVVRQFNLLNDSTRVGVLSYGSKVHSDLVIYLPEFMENRDGFLEKVSTLPYTEDNEEILTGVAMAYVFDEYFTRARGDRPDAQNVLIIQTDNASLDDVLEMSQTMRSRGFIIYAIGSLENQDEIYQQQLLHLTGDLSRIFFQRNDLDDAYSEDLIRSLCSNPCNNMKVIQETSDEDVDLRDEFF